MFDDALTTTSTTPSSPISFCGFDGSLTDHVTLRGDDESTIVVPTYLLMAHSAVLAKTLQLTSLDVPPLIQIEANESDLNLFISLMRDTEINLNANWPQAERVLSLCDRYDCLIPTERLLARLPTCIDQAPWKIFCLASHHDDISLAKQAIRVMAKDEITWKLCAGNAQMLKGGPMPATGYLVGLLKVVAWNWRWVWSGEHKDFIPNWEVVANQFEPLW